MHHYHWSYLHLLPFIFSLTRSEEHTSELQSRGLHRNFRGSLRDFLVSGTFSREKHLDKFFKNFVSSVSRFVLATCPQLNSVAKKACFAFLGQFLNLYSFPSNISDSSLSSSFVSLTLSPCFTHISTIFLQHLNFNLQENVWLFLFSLSISCL